MAELVLGPTIGGVSHHSAFLWGKADDSIVLHAWIGSQADLSDAILMGKSLPLRPEDGYAGVAPLNNLKPNTLYYYSLSTQAVPPVVGGGSLANGTYPCFKTFPQPGERVSFNFAFGSCFRPKEAVGGKIFRALETRRVADDLRFLMLLGDQIYADDCQYNSIHKVANSLEEFRAVYQYNWSQPRFRKLLWNLPAFMILDDHEVDDDWRWLDQERRVVYIPWWDRLFRVLRGCSADEKVINPQKVRNGLQAYWEHQGMHAPHYELPPELTPTGQYELAPEDAGSLAYTFTFGAAAFFVMDTRTMRVRSFMPNAQSTATMLGEGQWRALEAWLLAVKNDYPIKFIVTSCAFLFNLLLDFPRDRWSGYRHERNRLLSFLASEGIEGVYFLTGDLHSSHAIRAELNASHGRMIPIWEFCSTPFEQTVNKFAHLLYRPTRGKVIKNQECKFIVAENNFGLVRINFEADSRPAVSFEVIGEKGQVLASAMD
jgi:phosphodiesterase/alkaline phosphatase D-like protein